MSLRNTIISTTLFTLASYYFKNESENTSIPSFKNVVEVKSNLPGRLRLYVPKVANDIKLAQKMCGELSKTDVIKEVSINSITQSVLINYNPKMIEPEVLVGVVIKLMNLENEINNTKNTCTSDIISSVWKGFDYKVINVSKGFCNGKHLVAGTLAGLGLKKTAQSGIVCPPATTLFWWATSILRKSGNNA